MTEITRVPLQPVAKGSLAKLWLGVAAAVLLAAGIAYLAMPAGVTVDVITAGSGPKPGMQDVVFVKYTGTLDDGTVFDQTRDGTWPIPGILPDGQPLALNEMVPGFQEALQQMQKGGKYKIAIPSELAYGATPPPGAPFPPNANLNFEIQLIDFMSMQEAQQKIGQLQAQMQQAQGAQGAPGGEGGAAPAPAPQAPAPAPAPAP